MSPAHTEMLRGDFTHLQGVWRQGRDSNSQCGRGRAKAISLAALTPALSPPPPHGTRTGPALCWCPQQPGLTGWSSAGVGAGEEATAQGRRFCMSYYVGIRAPPRPRPVQQSAQKDATRRDSRPFMSLTESWISILGLSLRGTSNPEFPGKRRQERWRGGGVRPECGSGHTDLG